MTKLARVLVSSFAALLSCYAFAADMTANVGAPGPAHFHDRASRTLRQVTGVAGAAVAGVPVLGGVEVGSVAPGGRSAVVRLSDASYWVRDLGSDAPAMQQLSEVPNDADGIVWSGDGNCAVLFSSATVWVQRVCDASSGVVAGPVLSFAGRLEAIRTVAVDVRGERFALAGVLAGESQLYLITRDGEQLLIRTRSISALAFRSDGSILIGKDDAGEIVELSYESAYSKSIRRVCGARTPVTFLEIAGDDLILLEDAGKSVAVFSLASGELSRREAMDAQLFGLQRIHPHAFLLTRDSAEQPLFMIDTTRRELLFFVPEN